MTNLQLRMISAVLVLLLALAPSAAFAAAPQDPVEQDQPAATSAPVNPSNSDPSAAIRDEPQGATTELPDSPSTVRSQTPETMPASPTKPTSDPDTSQAPVGTAAAESPVTTGVAASKPAGTAIAPSEQKRSRSLLIKIGALVGAGVAVGTVMALSLGTSSKPPGAR